MRSIALVLFLLAGLVGFTFAQIEKPITNWVDIDRHDEEFELKVPEGFRFGDSKDGDNEIDARGEYHSDADRYYIFIDSPTKRNQRKKVDAFVRYAHPIETDINFTGDTFKSTEFEDPSGFYHRIILVETSSRVFTLQTVSRRKNSEAAIRFMNSFRLHPKSVPDSNASQPGFSVSPNSREVFSLETEAPVPVQPVAGGGRKGSGSGSGSGSGFRSSSGIGSGTGSPTPPKITAPLKVTYKLKASYTDIASFYGIQGAVTLRVTFLANGQIGSVTTIQRQPFGLTETAIFAARQMKFEPEMVNGVARTTTRPVSFTFSIY